MAQATSSKALTPERPRRRKSKLGRYQSIMGYLFVAPPLILFFYFTLMPAFRAIYLSLTQYDILSPPRFIGLENFINVFQDALFIKSLGNVLYYTVLYVPAMIVLSLLTASGLNAKLRGMAIFRTAYYMPGLCSSIAAATVWLFLLNPEYGLVNQLLEYIGITGPKWLGDPPFIMPSIVMITVWGGLGGNMVIYLAGLQGIPAGLYEAADLDGVNRWQRFRYITWPMLSNTTFLVFTLSCIGAFQLFDSAYALLNGGGPGNVAMTPVYLIYNAGFNSLRMGYASAMAVVLFLIILVFSIINMSLNSDNNVL